MDVSLAGDALLLSGSSIDGKVTTTRTTVASTSSGSRRSFSTVLQGVRGEEKNVRGEEKKREMRDAENVRSTAKPDRLPLPKEPKGQPFSSTQTDRVEASPSQTPVSDGRPSNRDEDMNVDDSRNAPESINQPNTGSVGSQGDVPTSLLLPISSPEQVQAKDRAKIHAGEAAEFFEEDHVSRGGHESRVESSQFPLTELGEANALVAVSEPAVGWSDTERSSQPGLPAQAPSAPVTLAQHESPAAHPVTSGSRMATTVASTEMENPVDVHLALDESRPNSALPQPAAMVSRAPQTYRETGRSYGEPDRHGTPVDRTASAQGGEPAQVLREDQDANPRMRWVFPQGKPSSVEWPERFSESWQEHIDPSWDQAEAALPETTDVDRYVSTVHSVESSMAGVPGRVISGPPTSPLASPSMSHVQPALSISDADQQSERFMTRSVVFNVAQPDMGHVNIRVAMMHDVVHTSLSTDRPDVGQFLINGQDRLQAALQANGLDMGQFRVDIDRQSAGRSFHHSSSQEQGQSWNEGSQRTNMGEGRERQPEQRASLHGLLNVVA
jgi:hypothetical protein